MSTGKIIAPGLRMTLGYADKLVQTIPAEKFSHMPRSDLNSPGFCIGHLALYASAVAGMLGNKELGDAPAGYGELFNHGLPCVDRPGLYPSKDALVAEFTKGWTKVADILPGVDETVFAQANPMTQMADKLPTVGAMVAFMCLAHNQMHLGQISAWRRVMDLGSAM
ncbi:MAG: DinB family protein [Planctomycetota bacterium]|nr:DinB family protein [Planctomycetota bacterium]MDA1262399.1 DinB family protein [Planctomycetota bacterium]